MDAIADSMMSSHMNSHMKTTGKGEYPTYTQKTMEEFKNIEEQCENIRDQLKVKNDEVSQLKQNLLLSVGAKMALSKVLGIDNKP